MVVKGLEINCKIKCFMLVKPNPFWLMYNLNIGHQLGYNKGVDYIRRTPFPITISVLYLLCNPWQIALESFICYKLVTGRTRYPDSWPILAKFRWIRWFILIESDYFSRLVRQVFWLILIESDCLIR